MGRKLYVGNLPYSADQQSLEKLFSKCGTVESVNLITDRDSGRSKGFGFIEMSTDAEAQKAIEELNGTDCDGRPLTVNEAKPQQKKKPGFGGGKNRW
jgi:cold-inducible RNA-binding protein